MKILYCVQFGAASRIALCWAVSLVSAQAMAQAQPPRIFSATESPGDLEDCGDLTQSRHLQLIGKNFEPYSIVWIGKNQLLEVCAEASDRETLRVLLPQTVPAGDTLISVLNGPGLFTAFYLTTRTATAPSKALPMATETRLQSKTDVSGAQATDGVVVLSKTVQVDPGSGLLVILNIDAEIAQGDGPVGARLFINGTVFEHEASASFPSPRVAGPAPTRGTASQFYLLPASSLIDGNNHLEVRSFAPRSQDASIHSGHTQLMTIAVSN